MKNFKTLPILFIPFLLIGCNKQPAEPEQGESKEGEVVVNMNSYLANDSAKNGYDLTFAFNNSYFEETATKFSDDIKMLSFASSLASKNDEAATSFFETMGFNDIELSLDTPTKDSIGYAFAHKVIKGADLVAISVRGFEYGLECVSNVKVGLNGNHQGFEESATKLYQALEDYLVTYLDKNIKLWVTGYSRAGAVANILASQLMKEDSSIDVKEENLYVYTFEAPRGLSKENAIGYSNVFNLVNELDLVTRIPPVEYELYRCGIDVLIEDNKNIDDLLPNLYQGLSLPTFTPIEGAFENELEFSNFVFNVLLREEEEAEKTLHNREAFVNNYQEQIAYIIELAISLPEKTINKIINTVTSLVTNLMSAYTLINDKEGLYNLVKPILDEDNISYDDDKLKEASEAFSNLATAKMELLLYAGNSTDPFFLNNLLRLGYRHVPECVYVLIK